MQLFCNQLKGARYPHWAPVFIVSNLSIFTLPSPLIGIRYKGYAIKGYCSSGRYSDGGDGGL